MNSGLPIDIVPLQSIDTKKFHQYLYFWIGQIFSLLGSSIVQFCAFWWFNEQRHDPMFLSTAVVLIQLPIMIFSIFSGVIVDRFSRKLIILLADFMQAVFTVILIVLFIFINPQMWLVILLFVLRSFCQAFHQPASNAIIPLMVPKDKLSRLNGINFLTTTAINIVGPAMSGFFLSIFTFYQILWIDVITFGIALIPTILIKIPELPSNDLSNMSDLTHVRSKPRMRDDLKEGFRIIFQIKGMLAFFLIALISNFLFQPFNVLRPYFVGDYHLGTETEYGLLGTFSQIGMMFGSLIMIFKKKWKYKTRVMMLFLIISSIAYVFTGLVTPGDFTTLYALGFLLLFGFPIVNGLYMTILQTKVPVEKQGRVNALDTAISMSISPIMTFLSGPLVVLIGIKYLFVICGLLNIFQICGFTFFSQLMELDKSHEEI